MSIKTEIWDFITTEAMGSTEMHAKYESSRFGELEQLHQKKYSQFAETLPETQRKAFMSIIEMQFSINCENLYKGIAMGLDIAKELQSLLNHPSETLKEASKFYTPISEVCRYEIKHLDKYFATVSTKETKV